MATQEQLNRAYRSPITPKAQIMSKIQASNRCTGSCPIGREGEVFFTTLNSNQHIHPPYSLIRLWAEQVEQGKCTIETPPHYHERFQSPKRSTFKSKDQNTKLPSPQDTKRTSSLSNSQLRSRGGVLTPTFLPLSNTAYLSHESYDASSPPRTEGNSIDNLPQYIHWLQDRFPTYWTLLDEAEDKLSATGFVFKSIIQKKNLRLVISCGVAAGIAAMFVDEARGYKRFQVLHSGNSEGVRSDSDTDEL